MPSLPNALPFSGSGGPQCSHKTPGRGMQIHASSVHPARRCPTATAGSAAEAATPTTTKTRTRYAMRPHEIVDVDPRLPILGFAPIERPTVGRGLSLQAGHGTRARDARRPQRHGRRPKGFQAAPPSAPTPAIGHPRASSPPPKNNRLCCRTTLEFSGGAQAPSAATRGYPADLRDDPTNRWHSKRTMRSMPSWSGTFTRSS